MTLLELLLVLVLIGMLAAMVGPRMAGWAQAIGRRGAANQLVADLSLARTQAVRQGQTVSFRIVSNTAYTITADDANGNALRTLRSVNLARRYSATTLNRTGGRIAFDSRGMYRAGVSTIADVGVTRNGTTKVVRVTMVGRIYSE
jgi:Tfp pilus assembly protein FimT